MKRLFFSLAILAIFGVLASCTPAATIVKVEVVSAPEEVEVGNLDLSEFQIKISYSNDTFKFANLEVKMFSDLEYAKFSEVGDQTIAFTYNGIPGVINITIIDPNLVTYTVVFKSGDEVLKTEEVEEGASATAPANPTKVGHTFKEWDKAFTNVTSNLEVNAVFDVNTYTVTFKNGTETITTVTVNHGESVAAPANPTKVGHTFKEWDKAFTNVTSNLEVNAVFDVNTYTVTFKNGTETITTVTVNHGESATAPANPTKEGHTFKEWDKAFTNVTSNLEVNAVFDILTYTVTFKNGTETIATVTVNHGESVAAPANPTKEGYTFKEWDKAFTNVTSNLEVNAVFDVNTYTVTFKNGTETITTVTVNHGESVAAPANPTKIGHTFKEWDKAFTNVTSNLEVNAVFDILTYTVTFKNGTETITTVTVNHGESATAPANPTKEGYTFKEWNKVFNNVTSNLEVNAVFDILTYTVTFKNGIETIATVTVNHGESATAPANPTKVGHTFKEWDKAFTNVTGNLEVNAVFDILTYTVTFKNGTETITTVTVNHGESATAPANPTKVGHTFKEWDKAFTNVTSNLEVNALFDVLTYTVTFKDGLVVLKTETVNHGESATAPANPTKEGYTFKEWDKVFTNVTSNLEVNAVFEQDSVVNQITISSHEATPNDTISVTVSISGEVNFASYDIRLLYDATKLQYISYSAGMHMQLFNKVADGELAFNYAGIANITNAETLITINFKVLADVTTSTSITFKEVAIAYLTNIYEVIETEFFGVVGNINIDATPFILDEFIVRFYADGVLIKEETVQEGSNAIEPPTPTKEGYIFVNWDKSFLNVQSDLDIHAVFEEQAETPNLIVIESKEVSIGEVFTVTIEIKGNVNFSSYDIRLTYDSTSIQLNSYTKGNYTDLVNTTINNEIRFNYVSITNKTVEVLLLTLEFAVIATLPAEIIISPYYIDISTVLPNYEVLPVSFRVLNGYINIHDIK